MLLRELAKMPPVKKEATITEMVKRSRGPANGQLENVRIELKALEDKHGMTTDQVIARFKSGEEPDEFEFVEWLMLARLLRG